MCPSCGVARWCIHSHNRQPSRPPSRADDVVSYSSARECLFFSSCYKVMSAEPFFARAALVAKYSGEAGGLLNHKCDQITGGECAAIPAHLSRTRYRSHTSCMCALAQHTRTIIFIRQTRCSFTQWRRNAGCECLPRDMSRTTNLCALKLSEQCAHVPLCVLDDVLTV